MSVEPTSQLSPQILCRLGDRVMAFGRPKQGLTCCCWTVLTPWTIFPAAGVKRQQSSAADWPRIACRLLGCDWRLLSNLAGFIDSTGFASRCAADGFSEQLVMAWLGHRDSRMARHYFHLHNETAQRHMSRLRLLVMLGATSPLAS